MTEGLKSIRTELEDLLDRLGMPDADNAGRLFRQWEEVAGEPWAGCTSPVSLRAGDLVLEVADGATASLLRYRVGELLERLDGAFSPDLVSTVRFRVRKGG